MTKRATISLTLTGLATAFLTTFSGATQPETSFSPSPYFGERTYSETTADGVRLYVNLPAESADSDTVPTTKPTRVILFALPNGNTIEQTLGCAMKPGLDWHYDIQHVAAQVRLLRTLMPEERIVLICAEAPKLAWPVFRTGPDANKRIGELFAEWTNRFGAKDCKVTLTGHSGGGSFMFGVIEASDDIPAPVDRIAFLDSNYAFDDKLHADKLVRWLNGDPARRLIVICYDDREIMFQGKKVVGPTGGTFRATERTVESLGKTFPLEKAETPPFITYTGLDGRIRFFVHPNPENKILHTALVGDMNGLIEAQTLGTPLEGTWGKFGGPRAYTKWIQAEPTEKPGVAPLKSEEAKPAATGSFPQRPAGAMGGSAFCERVADVPLTEREGLILNEITSGNFPDFERKFVKVNVTATTADGKQLTGTIDVMPDYLAIGSEKDFVRMPMRPQTAQLIADHFGCILPTRKLVDAIDAAATVRIAPQPLTENREAVSAFLLSNQKIEAEWKTRSHEPRGALVAGGKKDIVLSTKIYDKKPQRLVIYGWRQLDGTPIQPLTNVHWDQYVDYSHGVRLVRNAITIDGKEQRIDELLRDPALSVLVSDEGVINPPRYPAD